MEVVVAMLRKCEVSWYECEFDLLTLFPMFRLELNSFATRGAVRRVSSADLRILTVSGDCEALSMQACRT